MTSTEACNKLAAELDRAIDDDDVTLSTRQKSAAAVLMSLKESESLMETAHLPRHPKNALRWMKAIDDIENRRHITRHARLDE
jgi:antitoxin YefM